MTRDEINQFATTWAEEHRGIETHQPLPQVLGQFGRELQTMILEPISRIVLGSGQ